MDNFWDDDWFGTHTISTRVQEVRRAVAQARVEGVGELRGLRRAIDQLEIDIGRALLKFHSLIEVLQDKGLVRAEELTTKARELDGLDGESDGILHPILFRTEEERERLPTPPGGFLFELEKQPIASPRDFLSQLEEDHDGQAADVSVGNEIAAALSGTEAPAHTEEFDNSPASRHPFTSLQRKYLAFIFHYTQLHQHGPNDVDCQSHFGGALPQVRAILDEMQEQNLITRPPGPGAAITLLVSWDQLPELE